MLYGFWWLADKYFRRQEIESVGIFAIGNTGEFPINFIYCPASPSDKTLIPFGLSCCTSPAVCAEWGACTAAAWCRGCEGLGKTFGYDLPVLRRLRGHNEQLRAERCQELREPQGSRRVISGMGKKEKGSEEERSELKNQSTRAKGKLSEWSWQQAGPWADGERWGGRQGEPWHCSHCPRQPKPWRGCALTTPAQPRGRERSPPLF